jgi:hypothetical protein
MRDVRECRRTVSRNAPLSDGSRREAHGIEGARRHLLGRVLPDRVGRIANEQRDQEEPESSRDRVLRRYSRMTVPIAAWIVRVVRNSSLAGWHHFHAHDNDRRNVRHVVPADTGLRCPRVREARLLNPVNGKTGLETESEQRADRPIEEPLGLGLNDAFSLPRGW